MDFSDIVEAIMRAGRKGGVVAVLLGAIFLAAGLSLAREAKEDSQRHWGRRDYEVEFAAAGILLGAAGIAGGLWLIVTGGDSYRYAPPVRRETPADPLDSVPLPYALCLQCPRVVKNWHVVECTRCGGELLDIRSEEDEQWAREQLANRGHASTARARSRKAPRAQGRGR